MSVQINADICLLTLKKEVGKGRRTKQAVRNIEGLIHSLRPNQFLKLLILGEKTFSLVANMNYLYKIKLRHREKKALPKINN